MDLQEPRMIGTMPHLGSSPAVFRRLLWLLRPQAASIALGLILLLVSMPAELFPAFVWKYVADGLVVGRMDKVGAALEHWFSFGGQLTSWQARLTSALSWMLGIYIMYEVLSTI